MDRHLGLDHLVEAEDLAYHFFLVEADRLGCRSLGRLVLPFRVSHLDL